MEITEVKIRRIYFEGRIKAVVSVTIDNELVVHDIKIVALDGKIFVAMPSQRDEYGHFRDIVHPLNSETRKKFENTIIGNYNNAIESLKNDDNNPTI